MTPVLFNLHGLSLNDNCTSRWGGIAHLPAVELNDDLAIAVVVHFFKFANVACSDMTCQHVAQNRNDQHQRDPPRTFITLRRIQSTENLKGGEPPTWFPTYRPSPSYQPGCLLSLFYAYAGKRTNEVSCSMVQQVLCFLCSLNRLLDLQYDAMKVATYRASA